jgi:hypothetical protein
MAINIIDNRNEAKAEKPSYLTIEDLRNGDTFYATFVPETQWGSGLFLHSDGVIVRLDLPGNTWIPGGVPFADEEGSGTCDDSRDLELYNVQFVELDILVAVGDAVSDVEGSF